MDNQNKFDFNDIWKQAAKKYDLNKKDYLLWTINNELVFSIFSKLNVKENEYFLDVVCKFKPMWADEIYWNIMDPKSKFNFSKEPLSFRVIGSNIAPMKEIYINQIKLSALDSEEIQTRFNNEIEQILEVIKYVTEDDYTVDNEISSINIIDAINSKDYKKARTMLKKISNPYKLNGTLKKSGTHVNTWLFKCQAVKYLRFKK